MQSPLLVYDSEGRAHVIDRTLITGIDVCDGDTPNGCQVKLHTTDSSSMALTPSISMETANAYCCFVVRCLNAKSSEIDAYTEDEDE